MEVTDDMLMALADGELDAASAASLRAKIGADPALQRRFAVFHDSAVLVRAAFDPGPVPDHLIAAIMAAPEGVTVAEDRADGNVVSLRPARARLFAPLSGIAAAVALLAAGIGGYAIGQRGGAGPVDPASYASLATGAEQILPGGETLRMLGSYQTDLGLCRMASVEGAGISERRILCRDGAAWQVALRLESPGSDGFIPASDTLSGMTDQWLDTMGAGLALEPEAEAIALQTGGAP